MPRPDPCPSLLPAVESQAGDVEHGIGPGSVFPNAPARRAFDVCHREGGVADDSVAAHSTPPGGRAGESATGAVLRIQSSRLGRPRAAEEGPELVRLFKRSRIPPR